MSIKTNLSALAFAAAAFTTALLANGPASANSFLHSFPGHGPVITKGLGPAEGEGNGGHLVSCRFGTGCTVTGGDRDRDHDRDYDRDHDRDHDHDYGYGYDRDHDRDYGYDRGHDNRYFHGYGYYGWRYWSYWRPRTYWSYPTVYSYNYPSYSSYPTYSSYQPCSYDYKWASVYQPGYGLKRVVVSTCAS
jgi:hypothetical protein